MIYETPTITELGSVADFTRGDLFADGHDGSYLFGFIPLGDRDPNPGGGGGFS